MADNAIMGAYRSSGISGPKTGAVRFSRTTLEPYFMSKNFAWFSALVLASYTDMHISFVIKELEICRSYA